MCVRRLISVALFCAILMGVSAAFADYLPVLSLGVGEANAGSSLSFSWGAYSGTDHYEYSVRDTTTNDLLRDHKSTSGTSGSVSGSYIKAGHSYHIWVGAYDSSGQLIAQAHGDAYAVCNHKWSSKYGVCNICDKECDHAETLEYMKSQTCKSISDTQHTATTTYDIQCSTCRMTLDSDLTKVANKAHIFDSNGDCEVCDYRVGCSHSKKTLEQRSISYSYKDEYKHKVKIVSDIVCANANCGKLIEMGGDIQVTYEEHNFKKGTCVDCNYSKYEDLTVSVSRGSSSAVVGSGISATCTATGGSGNFSYSWTAMCDGAAMVTTDFSAGAYHSFSASKAGKWTISVTVRDNETGEKKSRTTSAITVTEPICEHNGYTEVAQQKKEYEKLSDVNHTVKITYDRVCDSCGKIISSYVKPVTEAHVYSNGNCSYCGAAEPAPCPHTDMKSSEAKRSIRKANSNANEHIVDITWLDVCADCGVTLNTTRTTYVMEKHSFNANNVCACGYTVPAPCDHASPEKVAISTRMEQANGKKHMVTTVYRLVCECGVVVKENHEEYAYFDHTFDGNKCTQCGYVQSTEEPVCSVHGDEHQYAGDYYERKHPHRDYQRCQCGTFRYTGTTRKLDDCLECNPVCTHPNTEKVFVSSRTEKVDEKQHKVITTYRLECECGAVVKTNYEESAYFSHTFEDGKCKHCGHTQPVTVCPVHGNAHVYGSASYEKDHPHKVYRCCDCGYAQYTGETRTMENCEICVPCDHANPKKVFVSSRTEKMNDQQHKVVSIYHLECECGVVVKKNYEESAYFDHTLESGVCKHCGYEQLVTPAPVCPVNGAEHVYGYTSYEKAHPHKVFQRCSCGYALYTGEYKTLDTCLVCTPCDHSPKQVGEETQYVSISAKQHEVVVNVRYRCTCGNVDYTVTKERAVEDHEYPNTGANMPINPNSNATLLCIKCASITKQHQWVVRGEEEHPHYVYYLCSICGERADDARGLTVEKAGCCECSGHWWFSTGFYDGYTGRLCGNCGITERYKTAESQAVNEMTELLQDTKANAEKYRHDQEVDGHQLSAWTVVASQATNKLTDKGFVFGVEAMKTYSDPSGSIRKAATDLIIPKDKYAEQQKELWKEIIVDALSDDTAGLKKESSYEDIKQGMDLVYDVLEDDIDDFFIRGGNAAFGYADTLTDQIVELQSQAALSKAPEQIQKLNEKIDILKGQKDKAIKNGKAAHGANPAVILASLDVLNACGEGYEKSKELKDAYSKLTSDYFGTVSQLASIIENADASGNALLAETAKEVLADVTEEYGKHTNSLMKTLENTAAGIKEGGVKAAEIAIDESIDLFLEFVMEEGMSALKFISYGATIIDMSTNHKEVYESAERLMALATMNAGMSGSLMMDASEDDGDAIFKVWAHLQMEGVDQAKDFINQHNDKTGVKITELGIDTKNRQTVLKELNEERNLYQNFAENRK